MVRGNAFIVFDHPSPGLRVAPDYYEMRTGKQYGTIEAGIVRLGRNQNGEAWFVVDAPRRGSLSGRSVQLTKEIAREMRDTLDALLKRSSCWRMG